MRALICVGHGFLTGKTEKYVHFPEITVARLLDRDCAAGRWTRPPGSDGGLTPHSIPSLPSVMCPLVIVMVCRCSSVLTGCAPVWPGIRPVRPVLAQQCNRNPTTQQGNPLNRPPPPSVPSCLASVPTCRAWIAAAEPGCFPRGRLQMKCATLRRTVAATSGTTRSPRRRT